MSRKVTLFASDATTALGNVLLLSDYPSDPAILLWKGKAFRAGDPVYGGGAPGAYESYVEVATVALKEDAVVGPTDIPV